MPIGKIAVQLKKPVSHAISNHAKFFFPVLHVLNRHYIETQPHNGFEETTQSLELSDRDDVKLWGILRRLDDNGKQTLKVKWSTVLLEAWTESGNCEDVVQRGDCKIFEYLLARAFGTFSGLQFEFFFTNQVLVFLDSFSNRT